MFCDNRHPLLKNGEKILVADVGFPVIYGQLP